MLYNYHWLLYDLFQLQMSALKLFIDLFKSAISEMYVGYMYVRLLT